MKVATLGFAILVVVVLAAVLLAVFARPFLRTAIIEPLAYAVWLGQLVVQAIPPALIWMVLVVIGFYVAARTLAGAVTRRSRHREPLVPHEGPVKVWAETIEGASEGPYYRDRLARRLSRVMVDVLAHQSRSSADQIRAGLASGALAIPDDVRAFLEPRAAIRHRGARERVLSWLRMQPRTLPDPTRVIKYLENELETAHGDRPG
jgi:hypothetical protein